MADHKTRFDAWGADFTEEQAWQAYGLARGMPWHQAAQKIADEFNTSKPSRSGFYRWLGRMRKLDADLRLKRAAAAVAEVGRMADKVGTNDAQLVGAYKALAADAVMSGNDPAAATEFMRMAMALVDRSRAAKELELRAQAQERDTVAEKRLAVAQSEARRLRDEINDLKAKLADAGKVNAVDPEIVAREVDRILGRK